LIVLKVKQHYYIKRMHAQNNIAIKITVSNLIAVYLIIKP